MFFQRYYIEVFFLQLSCIKYQFEKRMGLFKYYNLQKRLKQCVLTDLRIWSSVSRDSIKTISLVFTSLRMPWNPDNHRFFKEKIKYLHNYCPAATGTTSTPKFIFDAKVKNRVFWKVSYLGVFWNWFALNINLKSEWDFLKIKSFRKYKINVSRPS